MLEKLPNAAILTAYRDSSLVGSSMGRHSPLIRQWALLCELARPRQGATLRDLATSLKVSEKTVRRDLNVLSAAGFPLDETNHAHGQKSWQLVCPNGAPNLAFTFDEVLALYLGRRLLDPLLGTHIGSAAQRAFKKIESCVGDNASRYLKKLTRSLHYTTPGASDYTEKADVIDNVLLAVEDRLQTIITYQSQRATELVEYQVDPYGVVFHRGSLYVVAYSHEHHQVRHFKVDRIGEVTVSRLPYEAPTDFDLDEHLSSAFGIFHGAEPQTVRVRFLPPVVRYVKEGRWHASQHFTDNRDGSLTAEFRLSSTEEIGKWLLSFGQQAVALEPAPLRAWMVKELAAMVGNYEQQGSAVTTKAYP